MEWFKIETVKRPIMDRDEIISCARALGAEISSDAKIAVGIGDNEICFAIEDFCDYVFLEDNTLFVPENREGLIEKIEKMFHDLEKNEFNELAEKYLLSNQSIGKMLSRDENTISRYRSGKYKIPPEILAQLRRIVAGIEDIIR